MRRRISKSGRWFVAVASLLAALATGEMALRWLDLPAAGAFQFFNPELGMEQVFEPDPELFWRLRRDQAFYFANRLGTRGWLPRQPKTGREFRIACVGDSCTFGMHVRYEETYGVRLERLLQRALPTAAVSSILAANPGYSTHQDRVLFERDVVTMAPDVTVLYCGAWNDYVPAFGVDDAGRAARQHSWLHSLHLVQSLVRGTAPSRQDYVEAFAKGEAPDGPRVTLDDYRANVTAIIDAAQRAGSIVIVVLPPLTQLSLRQHPEALDYRQATRAIAAARRLTIVDAAALFDAQRARVPADWRDSSDGEWPCLADWVHPTAFGHRLLAEALFATLASQPMLRRPPPVAPATLRVDAIEPATLRPIDGDVVNVRGAGFAQPAAFERVWVGELWVRDVVVLDDTQLALRLPRALPPGDYGVELLTATGVVRSATRFTALPPALRASVTRDGNLLRVDLACDGPQATNVAAWFGTALAPAAISTGYGPFWLQGQPGRPVDLAEAPFDFARLQLPTKLLEREGAGWRLRLQVDTARFAELPEELCFQALISETAGRGVLTEAVRVPVPR